MHNNLPSLRFRKGQLYLALALAIEFILLAIYLFPHTVQEPVIVKQISVGCYSETGHALLSDGRLFGWGINSGTLGDGGTSIQLSPVQVIGDGFTDIADGGECTLALKGNDLYIWGFTTPFSDDPPITEPVKVGGGYTSIASGTFHVLLLKGTDLYGWGRNYYGELGDGTNVDRSEPIFLGSGYTAIAAGGSHSLALKGTDLFEWGYANFDSSSAYRDGRPEPTLKGSGYTAIAAGGYHNLALKDDVLYAWRGNNHGQLGDGTTLDQGEPTRIGTGYTSIDAGMYHSVAIKDGQIYTWGANFYGELGDGTQSHRGDPAPIKLYLD